LIIGFQDTVENVGDVFLGHSVQGGPTKTTQSLWHHNFATVHHRVMRFSAKCSERNSLHDLSQCLNTAIKYSLFLPLANELLKNSITFNVFWSIKHATIIL